MNVGFLVIADAALDVPLARKNADRSLSLLRRLGAQVVRPLEVATRPSDVAVCVEQFRHMDVSLLIIQVGTWCPDTLALSAVAELDVPILLWAMAEKPNSAFPDGGMLVGLTQVGGTLTRFGRKLKVVVGEPEEMEVAEAIAGFLRVTQTRGVLRRARVGLVGHGCPGMSDTAFHEMELRRIVGPETVHVDLAMLAVRIASAEPTTADVEQVRSLGRLQGVSDEDLLAAAKTRLGLTAIVEEGNLSAVAVKCWPELKHLGLPSPCYALATLSEEGIPAACEGDLMGAVSMLTLHLLTGQAAYLGDFMGVDKSRNLALLFHCGAAAPSLADPVAGIEMCLHAERGITWKKGVTVEFPVRPGRVTFGRLGDVQGQFRMVVLRGEAVESDMFVRGNPAKVALETPVTQVIERVIALGCGHHYLMVHGDITGQLRDLAELLGIECVTV